MLKTIERIFVISAILVTLVLSCGRLVFAQSITDAQRADNKIHTDAASSQKKVDKYFNQSQDMSFEYGAVVDERESLKAYNDYLAKLVADQQASIKAIELDINGVDRLRQGVVPLMFRMVDALEQFVNLDLPFNTEIRKQRVANLKQTLHSAEVTLAEKYRLILDAYNIEREYGNFLGVETGTLDINGKDVLVDFLNLGRVAVYAQSLDQKSAWMYNDQTKQWDKLDDAYLRELTKGIRMARKQSAPDLFSLPVPAAEALQ